MEGQLVHELEVSVPANEVWEVYGTLQLGKLVCEVLPHVLQKVEVIHGNGGVGTILNVVFPEGTPLFSSHKEKFTKIDNENHIKAAEVVEGGYLDLGFKFYRVRFEIIEKGEASCIIKSVIEYGVAEESAENVSLVSTIALEMIAEGIGKHLTGKKL